jgi:hypothetical protein
MEVQYFDLTYFLEIQHSKKAAKSFLFAVLRNCGALSDDYAKNLSFPRHV